jgi:hypothetical protein
VYVYVFGYTQRSIGDTLCCRTLYASCTVLLDQLLTYGDLVDETRRDELTEYPELQKAETVRVSRVLATFAFVFT